MGGTEFDSEKPVHRVTLTEGFFLGVHLVTQTQWQAVMGTEPKPLQGAEQTGRAGVTGRLPAGLHEG